MFLESLGVPKEDIHIVAIGSDIKSEAQDLKGRTVVFNKENAPDLKVSQAVRYSMSIPLLFSFKPCK